MLLKNSLQPLELVVSAIHCLDEKKGSSPQNILRFLGGKYGVDIESLKPHVQIGLKRGLKFGMINHQSGLYRLNSILADPELLNMVKMRKRQTATLYKRIKAGKRRQFRNMVGKKGKGKPCKSVSSALQKNKRTTKKVRDKGKKIGGTSRRVQSEPRKKKQKRQKTKGKKLKQKVDKAKKTGNETEQTKPDGGDVEKSENAKSGEAAKTVVKT